MDPGVIGADRGLRQVMRQVRKAAASDVNVVVRGETGSGKEVLAKAIHDSSARRSRPMVVANCAAIPHELVESELFGHVRGAFTGAITDHIGYFESAAGGTLLLDEIGDLDPGLQAKILRVVENRAYHRVGSAEVKRNRARLIAATNQPLEELIEKRRFRPDLYYRLAVLTISVPPLRHHPEDIPELVRHFMSRAAQRLRLPLPMISRAAMNRLCAHDWPGNVRELRNVSERLILTGSTVIDSQHVDRHLGAKALPTADRPVLSIKESERITIARALEYFGGNRTHAAEALGIGRRTLQLKIHEYGLDRESSAEGGS